jgi:hypothetical protein
MGTVRAATLVVDVSSRRLALAERWSRRDRATG